MKIVEELHRETICEVQTRVVTEYWCVATLSISGVTTKMTGNYRCVASNKLGSTECTALITVTDGKKKKEVKKVVKKTEVVEEMIEEEIVEKAEAAVTPSPKPKRKMTVPVFTEVYQEMTIVTKETLILAVKIDSPTPTTVEWFR